MTEELFDRSITPRCEYCEYRAEAGANGEKTCGRSGKPLPDAACRHYRYDPLRRSPAKRPRLPDMPRELFSIE